MRGDNIAIPASGTVLPEEQQSAAMPTSAPTSNLEKNTEAAQSPGSIVWWGLLLVLYLGWDYLQNNSKLGEGLEPSNIRANVHNIIIITLAAVIGINGLNVLFTKLAALKIPGVSKAAGTMLPMVSL